MEKTEQQAEGKRSRGRPRKDPRDAVARQKLIRTGLALLTEKGYLAAGINEVLKDAGVPKGCFYHYFKDKEDFGMQLIDAYQEYFAGMLDRCFENLSLSPLDRLRAFVDAATHGMAKHGFRRGCLVGNLGQEAGALPAHVRERLILIFDDWQSRTAACLSDARDLDEFDARHDPVSLAHFFWIGWEGAVLRAKLQRGPEPLQAFAKEYFSLLKQRRKG